MAPTRTGCRPGVLAGDGVLLLAAAADGARRTPLVLGAWAAPGPGARWLALPPALGLVLLAVRSVRDLGLRPLGPVVEVSPGPRRPAPHLAALSERPSTSSGRAP
ncbi:hypothetical protein ACFU51_08880, partial [Streptomyces sp. NPDC057430]